MIECIKYLIPGIGGNVDMTPDGDRATVYSLWDMTDTEHGVYEVGIIQKLVVHKAYTLL